MAVQGREEGIDQLRGFWDGNTIAVVQLGIMIHLSYLSVSTYVGVCIYLGRYYQCEGIYFWKVNPVGLVLHMYSMCLPRWVPG